MEIFIVLIVFSLVGMLLYKEHKANSPEAQEQLAADRQYRLDQDPFWCRRDA